MRARALSAAGVLATGQGDYSGAALLGESLNIMRLLCDQQAVAASLNSLAVVARARGDISVAHSLVEQSRVLWRELGDQKAVAGCLSNLANIVKLQGDNARARALYAQGLSIFRGLGD